MKKSLIILILINLFILPLIIWADTIPALPVFRVVSSIIQPRDQSWVFSIGGSTAQVGEARLLELSGTGVNYVGFKAPDSISANLVWTLPSADGSNGQVLSTNGSGVLSWGAGGGGVWGSITGTLANQTDYKPL